MNDLYFENAYDDRWLERAFYLIYYMVAEYFVLTLAINPLLFR